MEDQIYFWAGAGSALAMSTLILGINYYVARNRLLRQEYEHEFGFKPDGIRRREVIDQIKNRRIMRH